MSPGIKGMDAGAEALGLTPDEEALRSSREYALYYYKNRLANPRLPPPLPARNSPWPDGKFSGDVFADLQGKGDHVDATISLLFGQLREGSDPIPIQRNLLGQELGGLSSSLGAMPNGGMSPAQRGPDTLAAAWSNISAGGNRPPGGGGAAAAQPRGALLGAFGSPKTGPALAPLLTAELKAQASGNSIFSVRSGDEQALTEALLHGANSTPHTPMNGQNPVGNAFFGSFNDSPRPSLDVTGRTLSSNSMGGAAGLGKGDPKLHGAPAGGRLGSVIGDARSYMRTPSKLRIGTTVADPDPQQQLLDSLTSADAASVAAAAAAAAAAVGDADAAAAAAAAAAAQQLASASAMQAAVEALQNLPPAAIAAALGTGDHAAVAPDVLLGAGAAGVNAQQQMQAMYMAAMYPAYYAQQMQQAQQMQSLQAMQAAAMAGFPGGGFQGAFPPGAFPPGVPMGLNSPVPGLQPNPAMFGGAGGPGPGGMLSPDMAMLAAGMRSPTAAQLAGKGFPGATNPADPYAAYYHKMLEAQAALGGTLGKDAELLLRAGVPPPPPPPPGQPPPPPPPPKDRRMDGLYGHHHLHHGSDGGMGMGGLSRTNSNGREAVERLNGRGPGPMSGSPPGHNSGSFAGAMGGNSRLRATTGPGEFVMGPREGRDARGDAAQRRHSARRDGEGGPGGEHSGGAGSGHGARGPRSSGDTLLDEFKSNKTGKKYELKDILGHVCEFSLDQHGSRFIQQKLEGIAPTDLDAAFSEVLPRILHLMTDVFGNYVVQKFLEHGSLEHRAALAKALRGHVLQLSLQMYGCRVVQKALEVFTEEQQIELIAELDGHIMRCVRDQNGNHVIQKCIECVPTPRITAVLDNFLMCVVPLSTHPFGCRIIQRILEHVRDPRRRAAVMSDILASAVQLTQDQYGNYVIQHVLERGTPEERSSVAHSLAPTVVMLSMHKFASNVIEKCLTYGSTADRNLLVDRMLGAQAALVAAQGEGDAEPEDPVQAMMKDQFGNYVVQKVLEVCTDEQREVMLARVRQQLHALKRFTYGKHIVARVEKLLSAGTRYQTHSKGRLLPDDEALAAAAAAAGRLSNLGLGNEGGGSPAPLSRNGESTGGSSVVAPGSGPVAEDSGGALAAAGHSGGGADGGSGQPSAPVTPPATAAASDGGAGGYGASAVVEEAMAAAAAAAAAAEGREVAGEQLSEGKQGPGGGEEAVGGSNDKQ